jgi:hypothetical protein
MDGAEEKVSWVLECSYPVKSQDNIEVKTKILHRKSESRYYTESLEKALELLRQDFPQIVEEAVHMALTCSSLDSHLSLAPATIAIL